MTRHPARALDVAALRAELDARVATGVVHVDRRGALALYHYSNRCVYDKLWDDYALLARGLLIDTARDALLATPFPKFFNYGERATALPDEPFHAFEKVDGSLGIAYFHDGRWQVTTKGAFGSGPAKWAEARLASLDLAALDPQSTYLFEIVYRDNRIVVAYDYEDVVLLGGYAGDGHEYAYDAILALGAQLGVRVARRYEYARLEDLVRAAEALDKNDEGFVVRFASGLRIKLKGAAYCRLHALISRVTPLGLYDAMDAGDDLDVLRREIPEEFWRDFDRIRALLDAKLSAMLDAIEAEATKYAATSDRDVGIALQRGDIPEPAKTFLFRRRRSGPDWHKDPRARHSLMRELRPTANVLEGYAPSKYILGLQDDG